MYFDMAGVDHQPLKVCVIHQCFQNPFSDPLVAPPTKPAMYILPVSIRFWQISPGRSSAKNPEYPIDKLLGIMGITATRPLFTDGVWPDSLPCFIAYVVPLLFSRHFLALLAISRTIILHFY
jgi:hypothetical protein